MKTIRFLQLSLLFILSFNSTAIFAQSSKSPFSDSLVNDFCTVFSKASIEPDKENMSAELGLLILPLITKYKEQIKSEWGYDIDDAQELHKASEKIGQIAVVGCPAFLDFVKNNMESLKSESKSARLFTGKLLKVEGSPLSYLLVQNKAGKTDKIYWMEFFEGSDLITAKQGVPVNKAVSINFREIEMYDAVRQEYRNIKVATKLALK
jgi:hypothetical protein